MAKVLVADDSLSVRKVVERALAAKKIEVLSVATGSEAIEQIEREKPDLVVCDVIMPGRDGYQICEFVRTHPELAKTPVLLMSGIVDNSVLERAARVRSTDVMRKPFEAEDLVEKVASLLSAAAVSVPAAPERSLQASVEAARVPAPVASQPKPEPPAPLRAASPVRPPATSPPPPAPLASRPEPEPTAPRRAAGPIGPPATSPPPASRVDLKSLLVQFILLTGVDLAAIVDREGFAIEWAGRTEGPLDVAGAFTSSLAGSAEAIGRELGKGALSGVLLEYKTGVLLLHSIGPAAMLVVLLSDPAVLGKVRYFAKKILPDLAGAI